MLLLNKEMKIIGQGITGHEGKTALPWMINYGTQIVAGVTPNKGGQTIEGLSIFNNVKEAVNDREGIEASVLYVPPLAVLGAVKEALEAGIKFILIGAEKVPTKDASIIYELSKKYNASIVGPSSVGMIIPHKQIKIGSIGGANPERVFASGEVAIISKSGGMTSEIALHLKNNGLGISMAVGIGGDRIICSDFADFLLELEKDENTKATVIFGELGGTSEEKVAELLKSKKIKKPVIAFIVGDFTALLPSNVQFGHAGAIIEGDKGKPEYKKKILRDAGAHVVESFDDIAETIKSVMK